MGAVSIIASNEEKKAKEKSGILNHSKQASVQSTIPGENKWNIVLDNN